MDILPIDKIRDEDAPLVGPALVKLAALSRLGFPVEKGVVVTPPDFHLRTVLKNYNLKDREIFEQSLTIIRKEILSIPAPVALAAHFKNKKIDVDKLWLNLLELWLNEIRARVWKGGLGSGATLGLTAQPVFAVEMIVSSGRAYFDEFKQMSIVEVEKGVIEDALRQEVEKLVIKANKALLISQVYHWVTVGKSRNLKLVNLTPYTPNREKAKIDFADDIVSPRKEFKSDAQQPSSAVKVLTEATGNFAFHKHTDGIFINAEKYPDFDKKAFCLVEAATAHARGKVIFKLSDEVESIGGVRGALRLIHQDSLLKKDVEAFLFARNKQKLLNTEIAIPFVRSVNEFLELKRDLAALGVTRKGTMKLWMEVCVPENIINIEDYLAAGLDGVIINLDELSRLLGGFDPSVAESLFYKKQLQALVRFIEGPMKVLHRAGVPIVLRGSLALEDEFLKLSVSKGIWGIVTDFAAGEFLGAHLNFFEKRHVRLNS